MSTQSRISPDELKRAAAIRALDYVEPGMRLGLGTGSTARHFVELLGTRVRGGLDVVGVPTSEATRADAERFGVRLTTLDETPELDLTVDPVQLDQLLALLDLVREWNEKFNLTGITEPIAMFRKHLLDSLTVQPWIGGSFVIDVGSGAGFPGLPLAVVNPALRFTLLDSTGKKVRFLEHATHGLPIHGAREGAKAPIPETVKAGQIRVADWNPL